MAPAGRSHAQSLEYAVKANYLVRFAAFVEWPPTAFEANSAPLIICVSGRDPFGETLDQAAGGQSAHGRRIGVRRLPAGAAMTGCHILYVGAGSAAAANNRAAVLIVTDSAVTQQRGMIHFVVVSNRVRFHIDKAAATSSGLGMSSRLLNLAISVREGG
nr:YfiR family protein [Brevundimonas lenta]